MRGVWYLFTLIVGIGLFHGAEARAGDSRLAAEDLAIDEAQIRAGAEAGDPRMQVYLGFSLLAKATPEGRQEAAPWLSRAAEQGLADASYLLGNMQSAPGKDNWVQAAIFFRQAAEQGHCEAQYSLGKLLFFGIGVAEDPAEAIHWFRTAAEQDYAPAQSELGQAYATGEQIPRDYAKAVRLLRDAAEEGDAMAAFQLREMYAKGKGVPKDKARARRPRSYYDWTVSGAYQLFFLHTEGRYIPANETAALQFLRASADTGYPPAQVKLAKLYETGTIVERSELEAVAWYTKAAQQDHGGAQRRLVEMYHTGQGLQSDSYEAYKWLLILRSKADDEPAVASEVEASLSEAEKAEASRWAKKWKPRPR